MRILKKNEKLTGKFLKQLFPGLEVKEQYYLKQPIYHKGELIRKYLLIDFEIKVNGQQIMIEFNGQQHTKMAKRFGGQEEFRKLQLRDKWLKKWCRENGIKLIVIDGSKIRGKKILAELKRQLKTP